MPAEPVACTGSVVGRRGRDPYAWMMTAVSLNGVLVAAGEARLTVFDAGLLHGVGLFETMSGGIGGAAGAGGAGNAGGAGVVGGVGGSGGAWVFRLDAHLDRLIGSARELGLSYTLDRAALERDVLAAVARCGLSRQRVRLTVTGGDLNLLERARDPDDSRTRQERSADTASGRADAGDAGRGPRPTVLVVAQAATEYPIEMFERGVAVTIADTRVSPLDAMAGHKTLNYWWRLRELRSAAARGAAEALVFQITNHLCGGCVSNVFVARGGRLVTPIARGEEGRRRDGSPPEAPGGVVMPSPVLPGVTRAWVLDWAASRGVAVDRRPVSIDDVLDADEVFLTNASFGVLPVMKVEREAIGDGVVGDVTRAARAAWIAAIAECPGPPPANAR